MTVKAEQWVHGTLFDVEYPDRLTSQNRRGWGYECSMKSGQNNWFHISVPTPAVLDGQRPKLSKVYVLFSTKMGSAMFLSSLNAIHLYDGYHKIKSFESLNLSGDYLENLVAENSWEINPHVIIYSGLGISLKFNATGAPGGSSIKLATAGAEFVD